MFLSVFLRIFYSIIQIIPLTDHFGELLLKNIKEKKFKKINILLRYLLPFYNSSKTVNFEIFIRDICFL